MLADDLRTLREYINKNLKKGYIYELILPIGSPVLFIPKADRTK